MAAGYCGKLPVLGNPDLSQSDVGAITRDSNREFLCNSKPKSHTGYYIRLLAQITHWSLIRKCMLSNGRRDERTNTARSV